MLFVEGFKFRQRIYESAGSLVLRAFRESDTLPVVIKLLKSDYPTTSELTHYRQEFEITQSLSHPGIIRTYELRRHNKSLVIVFEDFGGMSIESLLRDRPMSLDEFFDSAMQVTAAAEHIHRNSIIHKDITPQNLVINPATGEVKIIDFGISTRFPSEHPIMKAPAVLEGTLPFMSPEQTGRMNRSLDYRSDFYSLGATLYQILTRSRPFESEDEMEFVHCHLAREPIPAHRRNPDVPLALSKIVSKLMAKRAEDRYQSAAGLMTDLRAVRRGEAIERFEPGRSDFSERFLIPERLYGRAEEVEALLEAYERARRGPAELMLVTGHSGVGKTALINEIHKPITLARGYFISGKFGQLQHNVPYSGLVAAFRDLVRQLLTESPARLAAWRSEFDQALTPNGGVILDVVPELEMIIGPQPEVLALDADEARTRFNRVMGMFLRALCGRDNVVVLFLDDLHWADAASLDLLRALLTDGGIHRLFVIGSYRDNEVTAVHPLAQTIKDIRERGCNVTGISVTPLGLPDVARLIGDTLQSDVGEATPLARLVLQKTQGIPLFVKQLLAALHHEGLVKRVAAGDRFLWTWDLPAIRAANLADNVVDLLLAKLRRLDPDTQKALRLAACIGNRFDIDTLAVILQLTPEVTFESLKPAAEEELIWPLSELAANDSADVLSPLLVREFGFQHDRIQQAAYSLIENDQRKHVHLIIGRRLQTTLPAEVLEKRTFEVVDHLNLGSDLIEDADERTLLARLNLKAANKASNATAFSSALTYIRVARSLLGEKGWEREYELAMDVCRRGAALEYVNGNFDRTNEIVSSTLRHARTDLEKAEVYFTRIAQNTLLTHFQEALAAGRNALALLGVELPLDNVQQASQQTMGRVAEMLAGRDPASLIDAPTVGSREMALAQRCLRHLTITAFISNQELFPLIVGTSVGLSLEHGNAPESALSFANYGLILGAFMGRYRDGYEFGKLALRLCDRFQGDAPTATVCLVMGSELVPWVRHVRDAIPIIDRGYQEGLDSGDILWAPYLVMYKVVLDAFSGKRLDELLDGMPDQLEYTYRSQNRGAAAGILAHQIVLSALAGRTRSSLEFAGSGYDETSFLGLCEQHNVQLAICFYKILKAQALYLFGQPKQALETTREIEGQLKYIVNHPSLADRLLYQSLSLASLWDGYAIEDRRAAMDCLQANLAQLKIWADNCPDNFRAKQLMIEAEIARIEGDETAADLYDQAIEAAHMAQFIQDEALANELAARFTLRRRPASRVGAMYLRDAEYAYRQWRANRKVEELQIEFPLLYVDYRSSVFQTLKEPGTVTSSSRSIATDLDLNTIMKAAQTISGEVVLGRLLEKLLRIVIENAGAQRGVLLLSRNGEYRIEAVGSVVPDEILVMMSIALDSAEGATLVPVSVIHYAARTKEAVVVDDAQQDGRFMSSRYVRDRGTRSILCQPILGQGDSIGAVYLENDLISAAFTADRARLLALLSGQIAVSIKNAELVENLEQKVRERTAQLEIRTQFIEQTFGRYMSNEIAESLLKSPEGLDFGGQKKIATILMSDLRGFTAFSENLPPETVVRLLNYYFAEMTTIIQKHNGTIDEFMGDGILVIFGAPLQRPNDAERAVACALEMQLAMPQVNAWNASHGFPKLEMGIGINTGEVVAGNVGSRKRAKYSVIGNNVNIASRIESHTAGGQVLISANTRDAVKTPVAIRGSLTLEPKGVTQPITVFEVEGLGGNYQLTLPSLRHRRTVVDPPCPLIFQVVTEKGVSSEKHDGLLVGLSEAEAVIRSQASVPLFTDLRLRLKPAGIDNDLGQIYGKIIRATTEDGVFALRFTTLPGQARHYFDKLESTVETVIRASGPFEDYDFEPQL
jgi:predicted ATPase/class 3 adenylate cyclase